jgi:hypothetical protein
MLIKINNEIRKVFMDICYTNQYLQLVCKWLCRSTKKASSWVCKGFEPVICYNSILYLYTIKSPNEAYHQYKSFLL